MLHLPRGKLSPLQSTQSCCTRCWQCFFSCGWCSYSSGSSDSYGKWKSWDRQWGPEQGRNQKGSEWSIWKDAKWEGCTSVLQWIPQGSQECWRSTAPPSPYTCCSAWWSLAASYCSQIRMLLVQRGKWSISSWCSSSAPLTPPWSSGRCGCTWKLRSPPGGFCSGLERIVCSQQLSGIPGSSLLQAYKTTENQKLHTSIAKLSKSKLQHCRPNKIALHSLFETPGQTQTDLEKFQFAILGCCSNIVKVSGSQSTPSNHLLRLSSFLRCLYLLWRFRIMRPSLFLMSYLFLKVYHSLNFCQKSCEVELYQAYQICQIINPNERNKITAVKKKSKFALSLVQLCTCFFIYIVP